MRLKTDINIVAAVIEHHINNPDVTQKVISEIFKVSPQTIGAILTEFYRKPEFDLILQSGIDSDRAIYQESVLSLRQKVKL